jgi:two-component sensor histidine kinase
MTILEVTTLMVSVGIKERTTIEAKLKESLQEKELLLSEIHHRVKNNLAIVSGLLYLQAEKIADKDIRKKFNETQGRIKSMALIHEKLYSPENIGKVEFSNYIKELAHSIQDSYTSPAIPVELNVDIKEYLIDIEKAVPCGLILNELVTNSFKYAFIGRNNGKIDIVFTKDETGNLLCISDNGIGFDPKEAHQSDSLGLTLVDALIDQMEATMTVSKENGTMFKLNFN